MFDEIDLRKQNFSFIGLDSKVEGTLKFAGETRFSGHLVGDLEIDGNFPLVIDRQSIIEGNIIGHQVEVFGAVKGKIQASQQVTFHAGATLEGEVVCSQLKVFPGAKLEMVGNTVE